jgi:hypothetical protein
MGKFIFDGPNLKIHIDPLAVINKTVTFSINELWSEWQDWIEIADNSKYPFALRTAGGDPIGGGQYVGTFLFFRNDLGWRGVPPPVDGVTIIVDGSFFGENPTLPVMENIPGQETDLIINRSALTMAIETGGGTATVDAQEIAQAVWGYVQRELTSSTTSSLTLEEHNKLLSLTNGLTASQNTVLNTVNTKLDVLDNLNVNINPEDIWSHPSRTLTQSVAAEVDLSGIPAAVWSYVSRTLSVAAGLTSSQEIILNDILNEVQQNTPKIDDIKSKTDKLTFDLSNHLLSYIEDKAGFSLTSDERTAIANVVEQEIINETDSEKVLQAITDKISSVNADLGNLTTAAIASSVWNYVTRSLTVSSGLTPDQAAKLDDIYNDVNFMPTYVWNFNNRYLSNNNVNISSVAGTTVNSINEFKSNLSPVLTAIGNIPANTWTYSGAREVTNDITLDPAAVWNYSTRSLTDKSSNITQVNGVAITIDSFKADLSLIPTQVWSYASRNVTNMLSSSDIWNFATRRLTENNANIVSVAGTNVTNINQFKADLTTIPTVDLTGIPQAVWEYSTRNTTSENELTPAAIWSYNTRSLTSDVNANLTKVNGTSINSINDFKDGSLVVDNSAIASAVWAFGTRGLTNKDANIISVNGISVTGPDSFKAVVPEVDLTGIPYAVWNYADREITNHLLTATEVWAHNNKALTSNNVNIASVAGTSVTSIDDFKADVSNVTLNTTSLASDIWNHSTRSLTSYPVGITPYDIWSYSTRSLTNRNANITQVNGVNISSINDFKTDVSLIPAQVWAVPTRTFTNTLSVPTAAQIWEYNTRSLTDVDVNITKLNGNTVVLNDFKTDLSSLSTQIGTIPAGVWSYNTRSTTNEISPADIWNYTGRSLTSAVDVNSALTNKINSLQNYDDTFIREQLADSSKISDIPSSSEISNAVWSNISRNLSGPVELPTIVTNKINSLNNYDDSFLRSSLLDKATKTDIQTLVTKIDSKPTLQDIELSSVLAKSSQLSVIENIMASIPELAEIRAEMINVQFGGLEILNNQMIIKDRAGITIALFDLFDKNGLPTMSTVYKRMVH